MNIVGFGLAAFIFGFFLGTLWNNSKPSRNPKPSKTNSQNSLPSVSLPVSPLPPLQDSSNLKEEYKMVFCVRSDLKMTAGKIGAQIGHATLGSYQKALKKNPDILERWENIGQTKVALKISSEKEMMELEKDARDRGILTFIVMDAGRTQIESGSKTVLSIGPGKMDSFSENYFAHAHI